MTGREWQPVGPGTPLNTWLETKCEGEDSVVASFARITEIGGDVEWINFGGATTVTHSTVLAPTHWRYPDRERPAEPTVDTFVEGVIAELARRDDAEYSHLASFTRWLLRRELWLSYEASTHKIFAEQSKTRGGSS